MGPKKKQSASKQGVGRNKPKDKSSDTGIKKTKAKSSISSSSNKTKGSEAKEQGNDNESGYYSGNLQSQPSQILGRKNRLNDLLASSQTPVAEPSTKTLPKTKKTGNKSKNKFEEDDGFIYKRGEDLDTNAKRDKSNKLISQLKNEMVNLSKDKKEDSSFHLHPDEPAAKKPRRSTKPKANGSKNKPRSTTARSNGLSASTREPEYHDASSLQLSSPIKSPRYHEYLDDDSSDEYVEQVSHLKMNLAKSGNSRRQKQKQPPNSKNKRRASYNNRGKRVLSIGNGFVGAPHEDVSTTDYYKLLDTSLPEPHRMKQLLIWCFKKKLDLEEKLSRAKSNNETTEDQTVINIAKVIKEEVLRDLVDGQISISWYNRNDNENETNDMMSNKEITLPNPLNITNEENIEIFTKKLKSLKQERLQWESSFNDSTRPISRLKIDPDQDKSRLQDYCRSKAANNDDSVDFNSTVLNSSLVEKIDNNYNDISKNILNDLEMSVDKLHNASYQLSQVHNLIATLQKDKLNNQVSSLVKNYMTKHVPENQLSSSSTWPVPNRQITIKEMLRGITRLDTLDVSLDN